MIRRTNISDLQALRARMPLLDVRTPAEFTHAHIPSAHNLPIFSNEERVLVGTTYKRQGREAAILLGFDIVGPKWSDFIRQATEVAPQKELLVYCWRGGMRSGAMSWALDLYGFKVWVLEGGYKRYRNGVLQALNASRELRVIGGMTGSGKTCILQALRAMGEQAIDLEQLAQHCGSTYGTLNRLVQPSQEQFENDLVDDLQRLDPLRPTWIEDESMNIGKCLIPKAFWNQLHQAALFKVEVPLARRVAALVQEYGSLDKNFLIACTERIRKRLGPEQTKNAVNAIINDNMEEFVRLVLVYYDKAYRTGLNERHADYVFTFSVTDSEPATIAANLLTYTRRMVPLSKSDDQL